VNVGASGIGGGVSSPVVGTRVITGNILEGDLQDVMVHVRSGPNAGVACLLPATWLRVTGDESVETGVGSLGAGLDNFTSDGGNDESRPGPGTPSVVTTAYLVRHVSSTAIAHIRVRASRDLS